MRRLWLIFALAACEGAPARSKPWRHAPDPSAEQVPSTVGDVLTAEKDRLAAMASRPDTLTVWLDADPRSLVPMASPTEWTLRIAQGTLFETLLVHRPGEGPKQPGGLEPGLARTWRVTDAGRAISIELQPGVTFHDGKRLTSVDVQFSLDLARSPRGDADHVRPALSAVSAVELAGQGGVRIYLHRADAGVLRALAEVPILPAHIYGGRVRAVGPGAPVVGTGPYQLGAWKDGTVRLDRWDGYWGTRAAVGHMVFRQEADAARALALLRGREIDLVPALIPEHYPAQARAPGVEASLAPLRLRPAEMRYLVLNTRRSPFDDPAARCAMSKLVDRAALVRLRHGLARAIGGPVWPGGPGDGPEVAAPAYDAAAAAAALDSLGWRDRDGDGIREQGGHRLLLTVLLSDRQDPERDDVLEALRDAGFVLDTREGSPAVLDNRLRDGKFDMAFVEWRGSAGADLSPLFQSGGARNFGGFHDTRVDDVFLGLRDAWEPQLRWRQMERLGELLAETCPIVPLTAPAPYGLVSKRVRGLSVRGGWIDLRAASLAPPGEGGD
jgi:peptide/nickel transport system substrate-binding protein